MPIRRRHSCGRIQKTEKDIIARRAALERQVEELRLSMEKVQQDRDRYVDLYDFAPCSYFICNKRGRILDVNRAGALLLGRKKGELLAMSFSDCIDWLDLPVLERMRGILFETGKQQGCELRLVPKNGAVVWAKLECLVMEGAAGAGEGQVRIIATDLKATRRTQSTLQRIEERYFSLLDLIPHGVNEVDLTGRIIYTNPAFAVMHEYERNEIVGMYIWDLLDGAEEDKKGLQGLLRQLINQQPPPASICLKNRRKDGTAIDIQVDWTYKRDDSQNLLGFVSIITDITERVEAERAMRAAGEGLEREVEKRTKALRDTVTELREEMSTRKKAQSALRKSEQRFQAIAQASNDIICICDTESRVVFINQAVRRLLGYEPEDVLQRRLAEFLHPEDCWDVEGDFRQILKGRRVKEREHRLRKRDNTWLLVEASGFSCHYGNDRYVGAIVRDSSKRIRGEREPWCQDPISLAIHDDSLNGILVVGRNREILFFNRRLLDLWGLPLGILQSGSDDEPALRAMAGALRDPQWFLEWVADLYSQPEVKSQVEIELADGRILECSSSPMLVSEWGGGRVWHVRDTTERKEQQRALKIMESAIGSSVNAICFVDLDGRITYVNQAFLDMWRVGSSQAQAVGRDVLEILGDPAKGRDVWKIVMRKNSWRGQVTAKRLDGSKFYAVMGANLLRDEAGTPVGMMEELVDISEHKKAQLALQESESRYRTIFEVSSDGICIMEKGSANRCGRVVDCNESFSRMAGLTKSELLALPSISEKQIIFDPDSGPRGRDGEIRWCQRIFSWRLPDGKENYIECRGTPIVVSGATFNLCVCRDNTQQRMAEEKIKNLLSSQLLHVAEEERKRIARDLHDEFGQFLPALRYRLENLHNSLPEASSEQQTEFVRISDLLEKIGIMARNISYDLRPSLLDDFGLSPTIEASVGEFMNRYERIKVAFSVAGARKKIFSNLEIVLYRVFQEAMNNVAKHAQAQNVTVSLTFSYPSIILMVADDGVGFDPQRIALPKTRREGGIGLLGMRERIASVDGKFTVRSEPGKGTLIRAEISQRWKRAEDKCRHKKGDHYAAHPE